MTQSYSKYDSRPFTTTTQRRPPKMSPYYYQDRMEETFGPNPCGYLRLINNDGDIITLTCDSKRCSHCAQRKMFLISEQMRTGFGEYTWVARLTDLTELNRALEKAKKRHQRHGDTFLYQIVGDAAQGWIVISDHQLIPQQRHMELKDWTRRITDLYQKAAARIRRSRLLGRVSLVPGYSEQSARASGSRLLANVAVRQLVVRLDGEKNAALGVEGVDAVRVVVELLEEARVVQPKLWKGEERTWVDDEGEERVIVELVAPALAGRLAELQVRLAGLLEAKSSVAVFGEVVYKLTLDRDFSKDAERVGEEGGG